MEQVNQDYELKILKIVIDTHLDKTIAFTEEGLGSLESNRDRYVWELSTKIYNESGHKVEFHIARDEVNSWLENKKIQLVEFRRNQKEQARQLAEENARRIAKEKIRQQEQFRQLAAEQALRSAERNVRLEEEARRIAEEKARLIKELDDLTAQRLNKKVDGVEKERVINHLGKHKAGIFFELQRIIVEELSVEQNTVNLDTDINECVNTYDALANRGQSKSNFFSFSMSPDGLTLNELIMTVEEEFDIEIPDELALQLGTVEQAVNYIYHKLSS